MKGIEINGRKLHEIGLFQKSRDPRGCVSLRYPKSHIKYCFEIEHSYFEVPPLLAVELYRGGIIPQTSVDSIIIKESGRKVGNFLIKKVIYPASCSSAGVCFELERIK